MSPCTVPSSVGLAADMVFLPPLLESCQAWHRTLSGEPIGIGDAVVVRHGEGDTVATIRTIEMHSPAGKMTIALDSGLKPIVMPGTVIDRPARWEAQ